jgi:undecaprenyl-diphosphatase
MKSIGQSLLRKHLPEYSTEIAIILVSTGLYLFLKLMDEVTEGETSDFDHRVLLWFRDDVSGNVIGPPWLEIVMRDITALGGLTILGMLSLAACGYLWLHRQKVLAVFLAFAILAGSLVNTILKGFIMRARPDLIPHGTEAALSSFPSGHAMMSAIVYLTLGALLSLSTDDNRIKTYILTWSILLTVMVGISRLYLGVHWPTDVIGGWIAGGTWALLCLLVSSKFVHARSDHPN